MNFKKIKEFVEHFDNTSLTKTESGWAMLSCCFAKWTHQSGADNNPSMGIKINDEGQSYFSCFSCMQKGSLISLVQKLRDFAGSGVFPYPEMLQLIVEDVTDDDINLSLTVLEDTKEWSLDVYEEEWLSNFLPLYKHPYLRKRGIAVSIAKELDARFAHKYMRIGFPIRDFQGRLCGFQCRDTTGKQSKKHVFLKPYEKKYNHRVWLGEDKVDLDETIILTEGLFDYARIYSVYKNVLASLGANISKAKLDRLKFGEGRIITFYDSDKAGDMARDILKNEFKGRILCHIIPEGKDAGELSRKELRKLINPIIKTFQLN